MGFYHGNNSNYHIVSADCELDIELIGVINVSQLLEQRDHYFHVLDETTEGQRGILALL